MKYLLMSCSYAVRSPDFTPSQYCMVKMKINYGEADFSQYINIINGLRVDESLASLSYFPFNWSNLFFPW